MKTERWLGWILVALSFTIVLAPSAHADAPPRQAQFEVDSVKLEWTDKARDRVVPVKIYFPKAASGPEPVIIFSHGLGGSREGYEYLGRAWASDGYIVVHLQHAGSDQAIFLGQQRPREALRDAVTNPKNAIDRADDVKFAIDTLMKLNRDDPTWKGRLDLDHIGLAGHSFGANTTLLVAGQHMGPAQKSFADPRVKAIIPISAPAPVMRANLDKTFGDITVPSLHLTGTKDDSPIGDTTAAERRIPFDHSTHSRPDYLVTFDGADHMVFAGLREGVARAANRDAKRDHQIQQLVCEVSTAFWDAYLRDDAAAKAWLDKDLQAEAGEAGKVETHQSTR